MNSNRTTICPIDGGRCVANCGIGGQKNGFTFQPCSGPHGPHGDGAKDLAKVLEEAGSLPENPKAIHGRAKPSLSLIPGAAQVAVAGVFQLGATKYGPYNWRKDPVEAETYVSAAQRHLFSWFDGEDIDEESGEPHLAHAVACLMILLDASAAGKMIDNRPYPCPTADLIRAKTKTVQEIK